MLQGEFYHELMRKYVVIFGTMFNNIKIVRDAIGDGTKSQEFIVPISYGPREKFLARLEGDPEVNREVAIQLPRMSFELTSMQYAGNRKLNTINKILNNRSDTNNVARTEVWNPVPYDMFFQLNIMTKTVEDGAKIVEQIIPHFTPDWTVSAKLLDQLPDVALDIPIVLNSVQSTDLYEGDFISRRALMWTLDFTIKGFFFGPIRESKIIRLTRVNFWNDTTAKSANTDYENLVITAGSTAANTATIYGSNTNFIQATAEAVLSGNTISHIVITQPGYGYADATVTIADPPAGANNYTAQAANVTIEENRITQIFITNPGQGYTTAPAVTITAPDKFSRFYLNIDEDDTFGYVVTVENNV